MPFCRIVGVNEQKNHTSEHKFQSKLEQMPVSPRIILIISELSRTRFRLFNHMNPLPLSSRRQHRISGQIVGHVSQPDFSPDPDDTDSPHQGAAGAHRHDAKDMLDAAAHPGSGSITPLLAGGQFLVPTALALQMLTKALLLEFLQRLLGAIGGIGPDILAGIVRIKQFGKHLTVVYARIGNHITADKLVAGIDADMVLVPKEGDTLSLRPARLGIFLPFLAVAPG